MKFFFLQAGSGYGARIYLSKRLNVNDRIFDLCKILSAWGGVDKEDVGEYWNSFEFPPFKEIDFKLIISKYAYNSEFVSWEDFLAFCEKDKEGL